MKQDNHRETKIDTPKADMLDGMRQMLARTICEQNRNRSHFISNLKFGDPIWDITLNIYVAEYLGRSTTVAGLSLQSGIPVSVVKRCVKYLMTEEAIFENRNQFSAKTMPYLMSNGSKDDIASWLDNCVSNLQSGLNEVTSYYD